MGARYPQGGCATMAMIDNARRLATVDEDAAAQGARPGQAMADALALLPHLKIVDADPEADADALAALTDWCARFSPAIAIDAPDGVLLDIDGCAHLWGGEAGLAQTLIARLAAQNIPARAAIADTFGAAWALARHGREPIVIAAKDEARRLAPLPTSALRIAQSVADQLSRLGLKTIGDVMALPRGSLRKRFGADLLLQLDRVAGAQEEPLAFRYAPSPWIERLVFSEPISAPHSLQQALRDLAEALCARLDEAGLGARGFEAVFHRIDGDTARRSVQMALPAREAKRLVALFAPKLEDVDPGFGVEIVALIADGIAPRGAEQVDIEHVSAAARAVDLAPLIDRLRNRLGAERVWRAAPFASHVPERAVARVEALAPSLAQRWDPQQPRPVRLFARPQPIEALAVAPDDPPFLFRWQGRLHKVRNAEGPERIAAEWWRKPWGETDAERVRDYYRVEDESGARFWVFRSGLYGGERPTRWWLHGLFA
jgi:protein ImuB